MSFIKSASISLRAELINPTLLTMFYRRRFVAPPFLALLLVAFVPVAALQAQSNYATPYTFTTVAGATPSSGSADGTGIAARFGAPFGVAADGSGNIYIADTDNNTIRKITSAGVVTTFAGTAGEYGATDGSGGAARFAAPRGVVADGSGNIYVADTENHTIRKITALGVVSTLAGSAGNYGFSDGAGSVAQFIFPRGLAVDGSGNIYVADSFNSTIRKITSGGVVTTIAGSPGTPGSVDGTGSAARFAFPEGVTVDSSGNVLVADTGNRTIRKITPAGIVTSFAGALGFVPLANASDGAVLFSVPTSLAINGVGDIYVANISNHTVSKIAPGGTVTNFAGSAGNRGTTDGLGSAARFDAPAGVTLDPTGNIYVTDQGNNTIRKITTTGSVTTFAGDTTSPGSSDGLGIDARFDGPNALAIDKSGNCYVADMFNSTIRKMTPSGQITTLAGDAGTTGLINGTGRAALFYQPTGVAVDEAGNIYVADAGNNVIRKITAGVVTTFAGAVDGSAGSSDGTGSAARFSNPLGVAVDVLGNIYVSDFGNHTVRKITPAGVVTTLAGVAGAFGSVDGMASTAQFGGPSAVAADGLGNVFVTDNAYGTIRKITASRMVSTVAGLADGGSGSADGLGSAARFSNPMGIALAEGGNLFVADYDNSTVRKITSAGVVTTVAGRAGFYGSTDGTGNAVRFNRPAGVVVDSAGNLYVADNSNNTIRKGVPATVEAPSDVVITITVE